MPESPTSAALLDAIVVIVILAVAFSLMVLGWRARRRRQHDVPRLADPPADLGAIRRREDLLYVATTRADAPLDRITVHGLGYRSRAQLTVADAGVRLDLAGERPVLIPVADLVGVGRATWTIDRAVSHDGLVFVRWRVAEGEAPPRAAVELDATAPSRVGVELDCTAPPRAAVELDSYVRPEDPAALVAAIEGLLPATKETA